MRRLLCALVLGLVVVSCKVPAEGGSAQPFFDDFNQQANVARDRMARGKRTLVAAYDGNVRFRLRTGIQGERHLAANNESRAKNTTQCILRQLGRGGVKAFLRRHLKDFTLEQFYPFAGCEESCLNHSVVFFSSPEPRVDSPHVVLHEGKFSMKDGRPVRSTWYLSSAPFSRLPPLDCSAFGLERSSKHLAQG